MFDKLVAVHGKSIIFETIMSVAAYSSCSIAMVILNKLVIDTHKFNYLAALLFFQALAALVLVVILKRFGFVDYPPLEKKLVWRWLPLTGLFVGMLASSMLGLKTMSISITLLIKNFALIFIAVGDNLLYGHYLDKWVLCSFFLMILGSIVGAQQDPWVTAWGLFWNFTNVFCTTGYQLYMKGVLNDIQGLGRWGPVYFNNLLAVPPLLLPTLIDSPSWGHHLMSIEYGSLHLWLVLMMFVGAVMTMASFWCMRMTSPTTYSVVGALNKVPLAILSMYIFDQYPSNLGAMGIACALGGGLLYTIVNVKVSSKDVMREQRERHDKEDDIESGKGVQESQIISTQSAATVRMDTHSHPK